MSNSLFDYRLRAIRRDRARRVGPQLFLHERAFDDVIERLAFVRRDFRSALLVGCPDPAWVTRLQSIVPDVAVVDPGPLFAEASGGTCASEDVMDLPVGGHDLCIAIGTLDTVNDLPTALLRIRMALGRQSLLIGALCGGDSVPRLRAAMRAADETTGAASAHVHPRIEPSALAGLLAAAGFIDPVVDIDRVSVGYRSLAALVGDLRAMAATNILNARLRRPLSKQSLAAANAAFGPESGEERVVETFDMLHFAGWTPDSEPGEQ